MSMKMGKDSYEKLIKENIEWIEQFPDTLERKHIKHILIASVNFYYPETRITKLENALNEAAYALEVSCSHRMAKKIRVIANNKDKG